MSQSPATQQQAGSADYMEGWSAITQMIREDGSWSGRERNCAFLNTRDRRFADASAVSGLDFDDDGRAAAVSDWDQDGDLDLWIANRTSPRVRFMRNDVGTGERFVALRLVGRSANRDAIGARVELHPVGKSSRKLVRTLRAGEGYLAQSSKWLHFGLGRPGDPDAIANIDRVVVRWPGGPVETFRGVEANRRFVLEQGQGQARPASGPERHVALVARPLAPLAPTGKSRIVFPSRPPMPAFDLVDFDGRPVAGNIAGPRLVNLWAHWCGPCRDELTEWAKHARELRGAKLAVVTLCADPAEGRDAARAFLDGIGGGFVQAVVDDRATEILDLLQRSVLDKRERIPLPTSFLVDARGRLVVMYKGAVRPDQIVRDVALLELDAEALRAAAVPFPGRWYADPPAPDLADLAQAFAKAGHADISTQFLSQSQGGAGDEAAASVQHELGLRLLGEGKRAEAAAAFEASIAAHRRRLESRPDDAQTLNNLGAVLKSAGRYAEAVPFLERALATHPDTSRVRTSLAECMAGLGRHDEAIAHLREAVRAAPGDAAVTVALAEYLLLTNRVDEAAELFQRVLTAGAANGRAHLGLSRVLLARNQRSDALRHAERAVELSPQHPDARLHLGQILTLEGRPREALAQLDAVLAQFPRHPQALYYAAAIEHQLGQRDAAREKLARLEAVDRGLAERLRGMLR